MGKKIYKITTVGLLISSKTGQKDEIISEMQRGTYSQLILYPAKNHLMVMIKIVTGGHREQTVGCQGGGGWGRDGVGGWDEQM